MNSLLAYIKEHYLFQDSDLAERLYREYLVKENFQVIEKSYGFITYKFEGDACIINDIYTTKMARKYGKAWELFKLVKNEINKHSECRVIIGFTEYHTTGDEDGKGAMLAAGFKPAYTLTDRTVFLRGTN